MPSLKREKAVVLLSSGLDSTVNLYAAVQKFNVVQVLTFDYGQRAAIREKECSQLICKKLGLKHDVIELPWLKKITRTSLVNRDENVPTATHVKIDDYSQSVVTAKAVWVPNRNGVFLNIAASYADSLNAKYVIPGFNKEEATTFADNSVEFLSAIDVSFKYSTTDQVQTFCFTSQLSKTEIVVMGRELQVPFELMWPCYFGDEKLCGVCESCQRFQRAVGTK